MAVTPEVSQSCQFLPIPGSVSLIRSVLALTLRSGRTACAGRAARAGGREEYAALGGSDGGRAPPRDFQPRASDIGNRSLKKIARSGTVILISYAFFTLYFTLESAA